MFTVDIIGIGAKKACTTWIADCLRQHPQICMSEPKEVNYFNKIYHSPGRLNKQFNKPLSWYKRHFIHRKKGQKTAEFSVHYLGDFRAPKRIKKVFPNTKIIACLRNPIDRAYSHYWMCRAYLRTEALTFEQALRKNDRYTYEGFYYKHLTHYFHYFDRDQILIVFIEDIKKHPKRTLQKIFRFIGVNHNVTVPALHTKSNESKYTRTKYTEKFMHHFGMVAVTLRMHWLLRFFRNSIIKKLYVHATTKQFKYPPMNLKIRTILQNLYKKDIAALEILLDKDLSHWK